MDGALIRTPDQRLRVFVSSTLAELAEERAAVREMIERLHLAPVMFELGARPHPPRDLYRAYPPDPDARHQRSRCRRCAVAIAKSPNAGTSRRRPQQVR